MQKQIKKMLLGGDRVLRYLAQIIIRLYQWILSPDKSIFFRYGLAGRVCRHHPHCSQYGYECFDRYNFFTACFRTMDRISRCTPGITKTYDPVKYRVVFASGSPIGVPFLQALVSDPRYDVVGVLTMPDMPSGRGMKMQENVIAIKSGELKINSEICRYFFLQKSLNSDRQKVFIDSNISWTLFEDWGVVVYTRKDNHESYMKVFQEIIIDGPWYFDVKGVYNLIAYKDCVFDLSHNESEGAKKHGLQLGIPKEQLDRSVEDKQTHPILPGQGGVAKPHSLRLDSKKYADEAQETYTWLQSLDIDILYVVAYGNLIPQHILDIPKIAPINIHGSLLPAYRGASPLQTVFLDGLKETGITLMKMEAGLDSGPMIDKQILKLSFTDTVADLINRVKEYTPKRSLDSIDRYVHGELEEQAQDESLVTHCGKIVKENGELRIKNSEFDTLETIYRKYKAYYLWPKIFMKLKIKNEELKIVTIDDLVIEEQLFEEYKDQGLFVDDDYRLNPAIISLKVKPEGGKSMAWDDFIRGYIK